jgi:hypothetical protein
MSALVPLAPELWIAEGPVVSFFGFPYPTRMAVIRLADGDVFAWSPVQLTPELHADIDRLGPVRHLVSPNKLHHLYLAEWKKAYPAAKLWAPPGLARRRRDLAFDAELTELPPPAWQADIDQVILAGSFALTEVIFFHRASRTAVIADLIQNFPPGWFGGWKEWLARLDGIMAPRPGPPREWRASFLNRARAGRALSAVLAWHPRHVVIAHGDLPKDDGEAFLRAGFAWLKPR